MMNFSHWKERLTLAAGQLVDVEIKTLYSAGFKIDLAYVESVFEADPESPELPVRRAEYKVYRLSAK
jgi:thiopurine S-methyltransferase